ncbi:hypothetical protein CEN44_03345 [Fischerella muscicola CCMEE 5323]|uniref:histidine kinase n=1 Tax=Fischerella muscicola CCMEE 5323 TaxID=2019572 RepID=A0A2N6K7Q6_FISMU|nr:PAS domain-containing protein [Fischerella muscicola]PLZ93421.1 hypothetical protein CEN44_03345 [Fischerella muscicola CCMEE 5323]
MSAAQPGAISEEIFAGDSEMAQLMRSHDWSKTPLGPVEHWSQSLKIAANICLNSRFPMVIWWGEELTLLYNDAWRPILGNKHPQALGKPGQEVWSEIWDIVGTQLRSVLTTGKATWSDDQLLLVYRYGYTEEAYFTYSYSPIFLETGEVGGAFTAVAETTQRVVGERRLATLRNLAAQTGQSKTVEQACQKAIQTLCENSSDIPLALLYLLNSEATQATLQTQTPAQIQPVIAPAELHLTQPSDPLTQALACVVKSNELFVLENLTQYWGDFPVGPSHLPLQQVIALPIRASTQDSMVGVLVLGANPYRALDEDQMQFLEMTTGHIANAIASARAYEEERKRAEALAELDRAKTTFFSNVSHEFRTPLTLMLSPLEELLANEGVIPPEQHQQIELIHRNSLRLLKLVNTLLDFSRIEAGRVQAVYEPTDLAAYTAELASVFRSAIEGLEAGADDYLTKPFSARELLARVEANLKLAQLRRETAQKEQALRLEAESAKQTVETILSSISDGFYTLDRHWRYTYVNDRYCEMARMEREALLGKSIWDLFADAVDTDIYFQFQRAMSEQAPLQFEYLYVTWNRWYEHRVYPSPNGLTVFIAEITDRKQTEAEIQQLNQQLTHRLNELETLFDLLPVGVAISQDPECRIIRVNSYLSELIRLPVDANASQCAPPEERPVYRIYRDDQEIATADLPMQYAAFHNTVVRDEVVDIVHPDGTVIKLLCYASPLLDEQGNVRGVIGGFADITQRIQKEVALREQRTLLETILRQAADGIIVCDATGKLTFVNKEARRLAQQDPDGTTLDLNLLDWGTAYDTDGNLIPLESYAISKALRGEVSNGFETRMVRRDGSYYDILVSAAPLWNEKQEIIGAVNTFIDISDRKRTEQALRRSEERFRISQELSLDAFTILDSVRDQSGRIIDFVWTVSAIALTAYAGEYDQQKALKAGFQQHIPKPVEPEVLVSAIATLVNQK